MLSGRRGDRHLLFLIEKTNKSRSLALLGMTSSEP
jgi:hypothetical protein